MTKNKYRMIQITLSMKAPLMKMMNMVFTHVMDDIPEDSVLSDSDDNEDEGATKNDNIDEIVVEDIIGDKGEEIEVELNNSGIPNREFVGKGVEQLDITMNGNKKYESVKDQNYHFTMKSEIHPFVRGDKSLMSVAANYLFTQVNEHTNISAKACIKKLRDEAVAAMLKEYKQLNEGVMPGKPVFGIIDPDTLTDEEKKRHYKL